MTAAFTIRLDDEMLAKLDALAADTDRSRSRIAAKAIEAYVELNAWRIAHIKEGVAQADRDEFATDDEVQAVFDKHRTKARSWSGQPEPWPTSTRSSPIPRPAIAMSQND